MITNANESDLEGITCNYRRMLTKEYRLIFAEVNGKTVQPKTKTNFALSTSPKTIFNANESEHISNNVSDVSNITVTQSSKSNSFSNSVLNEDVVNIDISPNQSMLSSNAVEENKNESCKSLSNYIPPVNDKLTFVSKLVPQEINHTSCRQETESAPTLLEDHDFGLIESFNGDSETVIHEIHHIIFEDRPETMPTLLHENLSYQLPYLIDESGIIVDNVHLQQTENDGPSQEHIYFLEEEFIPGLIVDDTDESNYDLVVVELDRSSQDIERLYLQEDTLELFRRSPSPFPTYERIAPRGSICSELLDDPITVQEIEETEFNLEPNHQYQNISDEITQSLEATQKYSSSPTTTVECRRSLSPAEFSQLQVQNESFQRSESPVKHLPEANRLSQEKNGMVPELGIDNKPIQLAGQGSDDSRSQRLVEVEEVFNEDFKNSLDGVKTKNSNEDRKREFKRKRKNRTPSKEYNRSISNESLQCTVSEDSSSIVEICPTKEESSSSITLSDQIQITDVEPKVNVTNADAKAATEECDIAVASPQPGPSKEEKKPQAFWVN